MADLQTMLRAFQNAKAAGDTAAASRIAKSIKQLQQQPAAPAAPAAPQQRDGAFMYGVDRAQQLLGKGLEVAGDLTGLQGVKQYGSDVVAQQEKDIKEGGYQPQYGGSLRENYEQGTFLPALGEKLLENAASGGAAILGTGATAAAALLGAPAWLVAGGGAATLGGSMLMGTGEAAQEMEEKTGSYDAKVAAGVGALIGFLDKFGAGKVIPTEKLAKMTAGEVIEELRDKGFGEAASAYAGRVTKAAGAEGATELAQEGASVAGAVSQGATYTPTELMDRGIDASILGGTYGGGVRAGIEAPSLSGKVSTATREAGAQRLTELGDTLNPAMVGNDPQAATELATRLNRIAEANNLNLNNVAKSSTTGAREAVDKAHIQMSEEIKQLARDLKTQLGVTDNDELSVVIDKVMAIAAQREARNKAKSTVGVEEMQAVNRLVGETQEGQRMLSLMRQMNELTTIHNEGYVGGLSKITDQLSPIPTNVGYSDRSLIETPTRVLGTLAGGYINPLIPAVQGAAVLTGRSVDALTGRRSRVAKYVRDNLNANDGIDTSGSPSVREARRREAQALKRSAQEDAERATDIHKSIYEQNGRFSPVLPQQQILDELGLSPQRAVDLLDQISENETYRQDAKAMIKSIMEGGRIPNMSAIAGVMRTYMDNNAVERDRTPIAPQQQQAAASPAETAGYIRGIEDNRAANTALVEAVNNDPNISPLDKLALITALADLRSNLGSNPAEKAMEIAAEAEAKMQQPELANTYLMPYINRVIGQQASDMDELETNFMAVPDIGGGMGIFPKTKALYKKIDGVDVDQGNYQAGQDDVTGNTYAGARVYVGDNGRGRMEVDPDTANRPTKETGTRWHSNLVRPNLYEWVDNPQNLPQSFIVTVDHNKEGHQFALQYEADVPTELYRKPLRADGSKQDEPTMRPRGFGELQYGRKIGEIKIKSSGRIAPIYDTIKIVPKDTPLLEFSSDGGLLAAESDPFGIGDDIGLTAVDILPTDAEFAEMQAGTFKPVKKTKKEAAYGELHERWMERSGLNEPLEYTPENTDRIARMMATEALRALQRDGNAIGWYDAKLKAAKSVIRLVEPRIDGNEAAFDYALAVTSNGQAVTENFKYALDAFRKYLDTGNMPEDFKQGGERNKAMVSSFVFYNAYQRSGANMPIDMFLDQDFTVRELNDFLADFNEANKTDFSLGSQENQDTMVKGSYVLGAKIGQGFYQNLRGNYEPLTADLWWMRMWNRLVGRPFEPPKDEATMQKNRNKIKRGMIDIKAKIKEQKQALKDMPDGDAKKAMQAKLSDNQQMDKVIDRAIKRAGETRKGLYSDPARFDPFIRVLNDEYQRYYRNYKKQNGVNHAKPALFKATGTHVLNLSPQLQATPAGGGERQYMRDVVNRARELLSEQGYDINTADFQALMWYPEKQLARKLGIAAGKGEDNDYLDAAILAADREGITNDQIQEALPEAERARLFGGTGSGSEQDAGAGERSGTASGEEISTEFSRGFDTRYGQTDKLPSRPASLENVREQLEAIEQLLPADKPIPVGMAGTPFENGLTPEAAQKVGEALGYVFNIYKNATEMKRDIKDSFRSRIPRNERVLGLLLSAADPEKDVVNRMTGQKSKGVVASLAPNKTYKMGMAESIWTMMHELGHSIERLPYNSMEPTKQQFNKYSNPQGELTQPRALYSDTFRAYLTQIIDAAGTKDGKRSDIEGMQMQISDTDAKEIIDEMINFQRLGVLNTEAGQVRTRREYQSLENRLRAAKRRGYNPIDMEAYTRPLREDMIRHEDTYLQTPQELAADMIGAYLTDPKGFKKQAPAAAAVVATLLNRASSPSSKIVQFYSAPLAAVVAAVLATLIQGEQEEEDKKAALSLGTGALSA